MIQAEKVKKKNFTPEFRSYLSQARKFLKKFQKIEKIKKPLSDIIFSQNGMRQAGKERKKFYSRIPFILDPGKKIPKKIEKKKQKIKKPLSDIFFSQNGIGQAEKERKKFQSRNPFILNHGKKIPKKIAKKLKKLKNLFPILILAKTG